MPYLCADEIAFELAGDRYAEVAAKAGRILLKRIKEMREDKQSFILESTLSGKSFRQTFQRFRVDGYMIVLVFLYLSNPELHVARVAQRVEKGGHHIPYEDIVRRYNRCLVNFWNLYRPSADQYQIICNDEMAGISVAKFEDQQETIYDEPRYRRFLDSISEAT